MLFKLVTLCVHIIYIYIYIVQWLLHPSLHYCIKIFRLHYVSPAQHLEEEFVSEVTWGTF